MGELLRDLERAERFRYDMSLGEVLEFLSG